VFAVVEAVLLRPLPFPASDRLLIVHHHDQRTGITKEFVPVDDYREMLTRQRAFDQIGAYGSNGATVFGRGDPYRARAFFATDGALSALSFRPALGRPQGPFTRGKGPGVAAGARAVPMALRWRA